MNSLDLRLAREGFDRIGRIDAVGRRSLWMRYRSDVDGHACIDLRAGREGDDCSVTIRDDHPLYRELEDVLGTARFAADWEDPRGNALMAPEDGFEP